MKTLKLLNKKYLSILIVSFFITSSIHAEDEPVDIWNLDKEKIEKTIPNEKLKIVK